MKKFAIICIASFYLLLTTGQFVCIVNCSAKWLISAVAMPQHQSKAHQETENCHHTSAKENHCSGKKDCPCCSKHGSYVVKENIKPTLSHLASTLPIIAINHSYTTYYSAGNTSKSYKLHHNDAPPPCALNTDINIRICTFLI